jgi:ferredoxin-NADP reductase
MGRGGEEHGEGASKGVGDFVEAGFEGDDDSAETFDNPVSTIPAEHAAAAPPASHNRANAAPPEVAPPGAAFDSDGGASDGTVVKHRPAPRICGVRVSAGALAVVGLVQLLASSALFVLGVRMMSPEDEEDKFWAVVGEPSIALGVEPAAAARGLAVAAVAAALVVMAGTLLADARDRLLAPWLNSFWAPRGLAAARPLGIVVAPRGRVIAVVVLLCAIAYIAYVPDSALFDGDPKLSKQLGTAAGDCMALALVPIPKRSILLPMTGLPFERAIYYHRLLGRTAVALGTVHGVASMYDWTARVENEDVPALDVVSDRLNPFCTVPPVPGSAGGHRRVQSTESVTYDNNRQTMLVGDSITPSVTLKRSRSGCIFNGVTHRGASRRGPTGTTWAQGTFADVGADTGDTSVYSNFCELTDRQRNQIGTNPLISIWVMHALEEDLYFEIVFSRWSDSQDAGFTYTRAAIVPPGPCDGEVSPCLNSGVCTEGGECSDRDPWNSGLPWQGRPMVCADYEANGFCTVPGFGDMDIGGEGSGQDACCACGGGDTPAYSCICAAGWEGPDCDSNVDECLSSPCANGGVCLDAIDAYTCSCASGFSSTASGPDCSTDINECYSQPCLHGGSCADAVDSYTCRCGTGWEGDNCAVDIDDCASSPCENAGQCTDRRDAYSCSCPPGWSGDNCAENIDECASQPCLHGRCRDGVAAYTCSCAVGWEGDNCDADIDDCLSAPCANSGLCSDSVDEYSCRCARGWSGENCDQNIDECASSPCRNGRCTDLVAAYSCDCLLGWNGGNCEVNVDECASQPCGNATFGLCLDHIANYTCDCANGWAGYDCDQTLPILVELQIDVEQFDETAFVKDIAELLDLNAGERVVVDSVVPGSAIVTFHIEGQGAIVASVASHTIQEEVQAAVSAGADIRLGGAAVLAVDGLQPQQPVDTSGCDRDALIFDGPQDHIQNVAGIAAGGAFLMMFVTSIGFVRRRFFQLFFNAHILFGLVALVGLAYHYDVGKLDVAAPFLFLMLVDYIIRAWLAVASGGSVVSATAVGSDCVAVEVSAPSFSQRHTEAGQYLFIRLPQISQLQWHPMTITSSPGDKNLVFLIKAAGDWSGKLLKDGTPTLRVGDKLSLDGPYGRLSVRLSQQRELVMVAGGIGCTPMLSILGSLSAPGGGSLRATFIWSVRELALVEHCMPMLLRAVAAGHSVVVHYTAKEGVDEALQSIRSAGAEAPRSEGSGGIEAVAGRPAFAECLQQLGDDGGKSGPKEGPVGVLACGPQQMVDAVKVACIEAEGARHYDFHSEVFEW